MAAAGTMTRRPTERGDGDELGFVALYEAHVDFVWRNARRMGVPDASLEDVVQDVFVVAHRRLRDFERRSAVTTWLFGILLRVIKDHRRAAARHAARVAGLSAQATGEPQADSGPLEDVARREAMRLLHRLLGVLDDEKRSVFVLVELEQISVTDAARTLGVNVNTAHARLRAARTLFQAALARHHDDAALPQARGRSHAR